MIGFIDSESFTKLGYDVVRIKNLDLNDKALSCFQTEAARYVDMREESITFSEALLMTVNEGSATFYVADNEVKLEKNDLLIVRPETSIKLSSGYANVSAYLCPMLSEPQSTSYLYEGRNCTIKCLNQTLIFKNYITRQQAIEKLRDVFENLSYVFSFQYLCKENKIIFPDKKTSRFALDHLVFLNQGYERVLESQIAHTFISFDGIDINNFMSDTDNVREVMAWMRHAEKEDHLDKSCANLKLF